MKRKVLAAVLASVCLFSQPVQVSANSISYSSTQELDQIPTNVREICEIVGHEYGICPELLEAIAYQESRFTEDAKRGNHRGMFQINVKIHKERIEKYGWTAADMYDTYKCCVIAADYLHELDENSMDIAIALCHYAGYSNKIGDYKEYGFLPKYVTKVLDLSYHYEEIHEKHLIS